MNNVLAILLAGGVGERLHPLTRDTAKPAVPFGGGYRIIDFTLSNCINSGVRRIFILTQYKALELIRHIRNGWNILSAEVGEYIEMIPPMKRLRDDWYLGTADAVFQNSAAIAAEDCEYALVLSADHIYKMNYGDMIDWHQRNRADVTIATIQVAPEEASRFGVCEIDSDFRIVGFEEKPRHGHPTRSFFNPESVSASMGIYIFKTEALLRALREDSEDASSTHDFGRDVIPKLLGSARVVAYNFVDMNGKEALYWRDVGTIDAYYEANMDLVSVLPEFNMNDKDWPLRTWQQQYPPAKFVFADPGRMGVALDSIVASGSIVSGGRVKRSIVGYDVRVNSYCEVENSIFFNHVSIGRHSQIRNAIIDHHVSLPERTQIGYDLEADRKRFQVTESGIVLVVRERSEEHTSELQSQSNLVCRL